MWHTSPTMVSPMTSGSEQSGNAHVLLDTANNFFIVASEGLTTVLLLRFARVATGARSDLPGLSLCRSPMATPLIVGAHPISCSTVGPASAIAQGPTATAV